MNYERIVTFKIYEFVSTEGKTFHCSAISEEIAWSMLEHTCGTKSGWTLDRAYDLSKIPSLFTKRVVKV